jgi:hypothetical protein
VLDGHDAAGKTTLAGRLARALEATYASPFAGAVGTELLAAALGREHHRAAAIARTAVARCVEDCRTATVVFDRHWMTVCTLLPERFWSEWTPPPPTTLCWSDMATTVRRLTGRNEPPHDGHADYLARYRDLARRWRCPVLRTDTMPVGDSLARLERWAREVGPNGWPG